MDAIASEDDERSDEKICIKSNSINKLVTQTAPVPMSILNDSKQANILEQKNGLNSRMRQMGKHRSIFPKNAWDHEIFNEYRSIINDLNDGDMSLFSQADSINV